MFRYDLKSLNDTLYQVLRTFRTVSCRILLRMRNILEEIKIHFMCSVHFFPKIVHFVNIVWLFRYKHTCRLWQHNRTCALCFVGNEG